MIICGLQKLSLLDYPEKLSATVFTGGCNFRCPFCHNASLVTRVSDNEEISQDALISFLENRKGKLDGVCITGGEPLLHNDVENLINEIRRLGFFIKLDTNGAFPEKLAYLIKEGLVDYVAMDIKNTPEKYPITVGVPNFNPKPVFESAELLIKSTVFYEFRTTLVREFHSLSDFDRIGNLVTGAKNYYLQNFEDSGDLVGFGENSKESSLSGFSKSELEGFKEVLSRYVSNVQIRN